MLVEIWSDVVCPWCAVGKARLEQALQHLDTPEEVEVVWRSFELDPHAPVERTGDYVAMLARKYGASTADAQAMVDRMVEVGAQEGLDFRFDIARPGNTFDAHRLLHLAAARGVQHALKDRLLLAYHSQGEAIGDRATLQRLAVEVGLEEAEVAEVLSGDAYADAVRAEEAQAREYGISGVPFFVLDGRMGISGAQPADVLEAAIDRALATRADSPADVHDHHDHDHEHEHEQGDSCDVDGCAVA